MAARKPRPRAAGKSTAASPREAAPPGLAIVGIGASAGGLHALEQFFGAVPADLGVAFVVVQHLDPDHASALQGLLQRICALPVVEASDGLRVEAGVVYVIPPNREMEIFDGVLLLGVPAAPRGQRMAIDTFFRSLADERGARAVGVILSGTGTDGTLGLGAIHAAGGTCLIQDPATAKFEGMPASALRTGLPALVAPAERLPELLAAALRSPRGPGGPGGPPAPPPALAAGLTRLLKVLRSRTGRDFSLYKRSSVLRRVERRMEANGLRDLELYVRLLQENAVEVQALLRELLVNVTSFFRDPGAFEALKGEVLPRLIEAKGAGDELRVWVAGCASGEEAYSIAIVLFELLEEKHRDLRVQLYATDLDAEAIAAARAGQYPVSIAGDLSPERLRRFFVADGAGYRVKKEIRDLVIFAVLDLVKDPPFTRLDLVSCRNVFIYLEAELQQRLLSLFHYALRPGGVLFLSPAEGIGSHLELFEPLHRKWRLFRARASAASARAVLAAGVSWLRSQAGGEAVKGEAEPDGAALVRRLLLQSYAPASVLTDAAGTIVYVHGDTGAYLRPAPGKATLNVVEMAREGLQLELRAALRQAAAKGKPVRHSDLRVRSSGQRRLVSLVVRPVSESRGGRPLLLVSFQEEKLPAPAPPAARTKGGARLTESAAVRELRRTLATTRQSLQSTIEEQQASHEELQSTNEELQSANEELQSTNEEAQASNEELETAKEELQSVNEELTTVNAELQGKIEQLSSTQDDLKNLFDAISVGTVFLDERLRIKRFSSEACRVFPLVPSDVGRSLADIKSSLLDADLLADAEAVLRASGPVERVVRASSGAAFLVRLLPYRTVDGAVRGVVLTFTDITRRVEAEAAVEAQRELAESIVGTVRQPLLVLNGALRVVSANRAFHAAFGTSPGGVVGSPIYELAGNRWDIARLRELLETILPKDQAFEGFEVSDTAPDGTRRTLTLDGRRVQGVVGSRPLILLAFGP